MVKNRRLKAAMTENGFSQIKLASAIGICKNALNAKVNGKSPFTCDEVIAVCKALQINDPAVMVEIFLS